MWKKIKNIFGNKENQVEQPQVSPSLENVLSLNKTEECELEDKKEVSISIDLNLQSQIEDGVIEDRPFYLPPSDILGERDYLLTDEEALKPTIERVKWVLENHGISTEQIEMTMGPRYSMLELGLTPADVRKLMRNEKEILQSLGEKGFRVVNPLPNKLAIGLEVPNKDYSSITLSNLIATKDFENNFAKLPFAIGVDSLNHTIVKDLENHPYLLIAGKGQQGKTSILRQLISSLLMKDYPEEFKLIVVSSHSNEFISLDSLPDDYFAVDDSYRVKITSSQNQFEDLLSSLEREIEKRELRLREANKRNIKEYNQAIKEGKLDYKRGHHYLPAIIFIIDEIQDFLSDKKIKEKFLKLLETSGKYGIITIITTKYTDRDSLTPDIRNQFQDKILFNINLSNESRLLANNDLATNLLPEGDVLVLTDNKIERCQTPLCETLDLNPITEYIKTFRWEGNPYFLPDRFSTGSDWTTERDPLFEEVARLVVQTNSASTSSIQRRFRIGYNRAGSIMDQLEAAGIVGPAQGGKPRVILVDNENLEKLLSSK